VTTLAAVTVQIEEVTQVTAELVEALDRLVPQLSRSNPPPTADELAQIVASPATILFVARDGDGGPIVGTLTLALFRIPTALRAWIEDVVVDSAMAGRGIGGALSQAALDRARQAGARTVDLTSRASREAANHLYKKIGFQLRDTNVYRYELG